MIFYMFHMPDSKSERSSANFSAEKNKDGKPLIAAEESRCPYCIANDKFSPMSVLSNGRLICEKCGHIVFPNDTAFRCPCAKCLEITFSPRIRRLQARQTKRRT
jgi:hypothetical protein